MLLVFAGAATGRTTHLVIGSQMEDGRPVETSAKFLQAVSASNPPSRVLPESSMTQSLYTFLVITASGRDTDREGG